MAELPAAVDPSDEDDAEATISAFLQGIEDDVAGVQRVAPLRDPVVTGTFTVLADGRTFLEGPAATRGRSPPQLRRASEHKAFALGPQREAQADSRELRHRLRARRDT